MPINRESVWQFSPFIRHTRPQPLTSSVLLLLGGNGMPISTNANMLVLVVAIFVWILTHEHPSVLTNAVTFVGGDVHLAVGRVTLGVRPGEEVTPDLDVVVRELATLVFVHSKNLGFIAGTELETGNEVDEESDQEGHRKGPADCGTNIGDLNIKLLVPMVNPTPYDEAIVHPVKTNNVGGPEQCIRQQS